MALAERDRLFGDRVVGFGNIAEHQPNTSSKISRQTVPKADRASRILFA
jgi:hypothetical protein